MKGWRFSLTGLGAGFITLLLVLLLIAINFSNNLIFTLSFFMGAAFLLSLWFGFRNLSYIQVGNVRVVPVHQGQELDYQIAVKDQSGLDHLYLELQGTDNFFHVYANSDSLWRYQVGADKRGMHTGTPLRVSSAWPLGLFKVSRQLGSLPEVLVYPAASNVLEIRETVTGVAAHSQSEAEELDGLREYQPGDNVRRIDWRAVARRQQLQVKHFDGADGDPGLWLEWQATQGMEYEQRISCLCQWVLECQQSGREFGVRLPGTEIKPQRTGQHVQACLNELALMPEEATP